MAKKKIHLVANAHIDPVWLWCWPEGASESMATFRVAAQLCSSFPDFIFNHNEALLYEWIKEYEPDLFRQLQELVASGKWHIMGGWFLQPDVNLPSGESLVRQILYGRKYFIENFKVEPKTAINFDSFGHSRGLVQILAKSGYDSYVFCRPSPADLSLPAEEFIWVGFDGSEIMATRATAHYNSRLGRAKEKVEDWIKSNPKKNLSLLLWGVGNHGGGPSKLDLQELGKLIQETKDLEIRHSTPEAFFKDLRRQKKTLPRWLKGLNPWAVGCYTSMSQIKKGYRELESEYFLTEKMAAAAYFQGLMPYPEEELKQALRDLLFIQFHDILPGSATKSAEKDALKIIHHGLEILARIKAKVFFLTASAEEEAKEGEIPILILNPHPFPLKTLMEVEFQPHEMNWEGGFWWPRLEVNGQPVPCQLEKEESNLNVEWRKKIVFEADLKPGEMHRFSCYLERKEQRPIREIKEENGFIHFKSADLEVSVNCSTGLIDRLRVRGQEIFEPRAFEPLVMMDNADPWGMAVKAFREIAGRFELLPYENKTWLIQGLSSPLPSVRVIEDGPVRTIIESVFGYNLSLFLIRYKLPKKGTEIEIEVVVYWQEKDRLLKLSLPTTFHEAWYLGQTVYGVEELPVDGSETVSQRWVALISKNQDLALTCINDGLYGSDCRAGEIRLSLLRSTAYSADPVPDRPMLAQDRFIARQDQGERMFRFWINAGPVEERLSLVEREALIHHEKPLALFHFPPGKGKKVKPLLILDTPAVIIPAIKKSEAGNDLVIRIFEPTGISREAIIKLPLFGVKKRFRLKPFELKTVRFDPKKKTFVNCDLMEKTKAEVKK